MSDKVPKDPLSERYASQLREVLIGAEIKAIALCDLPDGYKGQNLKLIFNNGIELIISGFVSYNDISK